MKIFAHIGWHDSKFETLLQPWIGLAHVYKKAFISLTQIYQMFAKSTMYSDEWMSVNANKKNQVHSSW